MFIVGIHKLDKNAVIPKYQTEGASGFDLCTTEDFIIYPMQRKLIPTGLVFIIPKGYEMQLRPRSGLALKHGITLVNTPATIDSDYRGEVKILMTNLGDREVSFLAGDRIAQGVIAPIHRVAFTEVDRVSSTARGAGGFGSTGAC
jgi:dUTP pyrophosphatase